MIVTISIAYLTVVYKAWYLLPLFMVTWLIDIVFLAIVGDVIMKLIDKTKPTKRVRKE